MEKEIAKTFMVAGAVLKQDNKHLLVQEKKEEVRGKWNIPAG